MRPAPHRALLAVLGSALLVAGCGGGVDEEVSSASRSAAGESAGSSSAEVPVDYDTVAVPEEFGGGELPVPPGLTPSEPVIDGSTWEIEIDGIDKEEGVAFYAEALPAVGFTVELDDPLLVRASDDTRTVVATLSSGPDGVSVSVEPAS